MNFSSLDYEQQHFLIILLKAHLALKEAVFPDQAQAYIKELACSRHIPSAPGWDFGSLDADHTDNLFIIFDQLFERLADGSIRRLAFDVLQALREQRLRAKIWQQYFEYTTPKTQTL